MEDVRKKEGLALEELEAQSVELLPDREELKPRNIFSKNLAVAINGSAANAGAVQIFVVD